MYAMLVAIERTVDAVRAGAPSLTPSERAAVVIFARHVALVTEASNRLFDAMHEGAGAPTVDRMIEILDGRR